MSEFRITKEELRQTYQFILAVISINQQMELATKATVNMVDRLASMLPEMTIQEYGSPQVQYVMRLQTFFKDFYAGLKELSALHPLVENSLNNRPTEQDIKRAVSELFKGIQDELDKQG